MYNNHTHHSTKVGESQGIGLVFCFVVFPLFLESHQSFNSFSFLLACFFFSFFLYFFVYFFPALALVLNVEASEYVGMISHEVGVVALVHDPGVAPFPNTEGLIIPTGFKTNVAFTKVLSTDRIIDRLFDRLID